MTSRTSVSLASTSCGGNSRIESSQKAFDYCCAERPKFSGHLGCTCRFLKEQVHPSAGNGGHPCHAGSSNTIIIPKIVHDLVVCRLYLSDTSTSIRRLTCQ